MEIKQITEQNPWWEDKEKINNDEKIKEVFSKKHKLIFPFEKGNFLIIGPRQVGKTTHLKLTLKNLIEKGFDPKRLLYFSCELLKNFEEIIEIVRFSDSLIKGEKYFFFDEITFIKDWQRAIKYILDSPLTEEKFFYITASSSIALRKETFPGRNIEIKNFLPLTFRKFTQVFGTEKLKEKINSLKIEKINIEEVYEKIKEIFFFFKEISELFNKYLKSGGFPRSMYELMEEDVIREETLEIYWKWLIADIAKIERSERITHSILIAILKNYGTRFSLNSIAKEMEIGSHVTIREYLEILENLFVLRNIFPFDFKKGVEIFRKMRKVYFIDPFLFTVFKKILTRRSIEVEEISKIIEGIVGEHLIRKLGKLHYLIAKTKKEIDFFLDKTAIEVKWQEKVSFRDFPHLINIENKILLSKSDLDFLKKEKTLILPLPLFLVLLE